MSARLTEETELHLDETLVPGSVFRDNSGVGSSEYIVALVPWQAQEADILVRVEDGWHESLVFRKRGNGLYEIVGVALVSHDYQMRNSRKSVNRVGPIKSDTHIQIPRPELYVDLDDLVAFEVF